MVLGNDCPVQRRLGPALDFFSQQAALAGDASDAMDKTFTIYCLILLLLKLGQYRPGLQLSGGARSIQPV